MKLRRGNLTRRVAIFLLASFLCNIFSPFFSYQSNVVEAAADSWIKKDDTTIVHFDANNVPHIWLEERIGYMNIRLLDNKPTLVGVYHPANKDERFSNIPMRTSSMSNSPTTSKQELTMVVSKVPDVDPATEDKLILGVAITEGFGLFQESSKPYNSTGTLLSKISDNEARNGTPMVNRTINATNDSKYAASLSSTVFPVAYRLENSTNSNLNSIIAQCKTKYGIKVTPTVIPNELKNHLSSIGFSSDDIKPADIHKLYQTYYQVSANDDVHTYYLPPKILSDKTIDSVTSGSYKALIIVSFLVAWALVETQSWTFM